MWSAGHWLSEERQQEVLNQHFSYNNYFKEQLELNIWKNKVMLLRAKTTNAKDVPCFLVNVALKVSMTIPADKL